MSGTWLKTKCAPTENRPNTLVSELRLFKCRRIFFSRKIFTQPHCGNLLPLPALVRFARWLDKNILSKVVFSESNNASASGGGDLGEAVWLSRQQRVNWNVFLILQLYSIEIGGQRPWKGGTLLQSFYSGQSKWEIIFLKLFLHVKFLKDTKKHRGLSICRLAIEGQAWAWIRGSFTLSDLRVNDSVKLLLPELSLM